MSYTAPVYLLQPGQRETIPVVGREIAVIEADKDFLIAVNSGEPHFITAGLQLRMENTFDNIVLRNPHAEAISIRLGITDGAIKDNRASVSATLPVRDPDDLSSFSDVIAKNAEILAMMQNANDQKSPATPIQDSVYALDTPAAGVYTAVLPASNTAGVLVRAAIINSGGPAISIFADTAAPSAWNDTTKKRIGGLRANGSQFLRDLYLPAGTGLYVAPSNTNVDASIVYEVL
ncbi:hypothetical protein L6172_09875 [Thalassospiraceae bacterium SW-3-3]|nr:hypothetical protein L6172_09875 [Thalassospiraceae bacterium SW-3-3]